MDEQQDWFSSDLHAGHDKVREYSNRPFADVGSMNDLIVKNINDKVKKSDNFWILGDVCFGGSNAIRDFVGRINCVNIFLILGNHDKKKRDVYLESGFFQVENYKELKRTVRGKRIKIILSHYPFETWNAAHYGSWHLHGHCHGNLNNSLEKEGISNPKILRLDVGVDVHNFMPLNLSDISNIFDKHYTGDLENDK